jgi:hypothetical protein
MSTTPIKLGRILSRTCPKVKGLSNPVIIFHKYFKQTMSVFNPNNDRTEVKLIHYEEQLTDISKHFFVFRIKNTYTNKFDFVGIVSVIPESELVSGKNTHFILRYINSKQLKDTMFLLGIFDLDENFEFPCYDNKQKWLDYLLDNPYVLTKCQETSEPKVQKCDSLPNERSFFSAIMILLKKVLKSFGIKVSFNELSYNENILKIVDTTFAKYQFIKVLIMTWN